MKLRTKRLKLSTSQKVYHSKGVTRHEIQHVNLATSQWTDAAVLRLYGLLRLSILLRLYDLRDWSADRSKLGKGLTLSKAELIALKELLKCVEQ